MHLLHNNPQTSNDYLEAMFVPPVQPKNRHNFFLMRQVFLKQFEWTVNTRQFVIVHVPSIKSKDTEISGTLHVDNAVFHFHARAPDAVTKAAR